MTIEVRSLGSVDKGHQSRHSRGCRLCCKVSYMAEHTLGQAERPAGHNIPTDQADNCNTIRIT